MDIAVAAAIGLVSGVLGGILGVGGGSVIIPGLVLLVGTEQHMAQGISLAAMTLTALVGAFVHHKQDNVNIKAALLIAPCAVAFVYLGAWAAGSVSAEWLTRLFAIFIILTGCWLLLSRRGKQNVGVE